MNEYGPVPGPLSGTAGPGSQAGPGEMAAIGASLPSMLLHRALHSGSRVILRKKDRGIWNEVTWADLGAHARRVGMGLAALGFAAGDRAAVMADTGPDWAYADLGILGVGGVSVGIYPTGGPEQVAHVLRDSGAVVLFVENEEQLDKALEARETCPALRRIVVFRMTGLRDLDDPMCESLADFLARGAAHDGAHPDAWAAGIAAIAGDDLAVLIYGAGNGETSDGEAGGPAGAMLTHRGILFQIVNAAALLGQMQGDERLAFMSMCHVSERVAGFYQALYAGTVSNYAEDQGTVLENLRELQPTVQAGMPRFWERFHARVTIAVADATWLQRLIYRWAIGTGLRRADARLAGRRPGGGTLLGYALASRLVLRNIRRQIGIDRLRRGFVSGAPTAPELVRWYLALGVDLLEIYGTTECAGIAAIMPAGDIRLNTVGRPVPYGDIALSPDGEILLRGGHVFQGYWNRPQQTARVLRDFWLHTGDVGAMADGQLRVIDRMRDMMTTATGARVNPAAIETALAFSPYIADAVVVGDARPRLTCLVMLDHETVEKWAQDNAVAFTSFASLARTDAVRALVQAEVARVNAGVARADPIQDFRLIERKLEPEDPELTPALRLSRPFMRTSYATLIETMYARP